MTRAVRLVGVAIFLALVAAGVAFADPAAGVVLLALALAIACTALRHHLRKEPRR